MNTNEVLILRCVYNLMHANLAIMDDMIASQVNPREALVQERANLKLNMALIKRDMRE